VELLTEFQSGTSGAAGQTKNFISKVSNHRKNKGFELLPGLEPWAVPAARQETSDMGFGCDEGSSSRQGAEGQSGSMMRISRNSASELG
jgi:hypothetical protein